MSAIPGGRGSAPDEEDAERMALLLPRQQPQPQPQQQNVSPLIPGGAAPETKKKKEEGSPLHHFQYGSTGAPTTTVASRSAPADPLSPTATRTTTSTSRGRSSSHNNLRSGTTTTTGVVRFDDVPVSTSPSYHRFALGHEDDTITNTSSYNAYPDGSVEMSDDNHTEDDDDDDDEESYRKLKYLPCLKVPSLRKLALLLSLNVNIVITIAKLVAYLQSFSLSVLAALLDSVLDILSQLVLNYTEKHSSLQRSSAHYPAGASRLEPIGVLTCAALMGMASFEVLKESLVSLVSQASPLADNLSLASFYNMLAVIAAKLALLYLCNVAAHRKTVVLRGGGSRVPNENDDDDEENPNAALIMTKGSADDAAYDGAASYQGGVGGGGAASSAVSATSSSRAVVVQLADPTLEAIAQDHFNDILSNGVAAVALLVALKDPHLWFLDPVGAIAISVYIIYSWYRTGKEQIEHLTGKSAPEDLIDELKELAENFDDRMQVDVVRAYHFGPKFLVEIEVVMPKTTLLFESHDVGMELQYEIESREEIERCFVHIDYQQRPYDEHVVSKVPELREKYRPKKQRSTLSL